MAYTEIVKFDDKQLALAFELMKLIKDNPVYMDAMRLSMLYCKKHPDRHLDWHECSIFLDALCNMGIVKYALNANGLANYIWNTKE